MPDPSPSPTPNFHLHLNGWSLDEDLAQCRTVLDAGADAAVLFYAGRILDILLKRAVELAQGKPSSTSYGNLVLLDDLGLLPRTTVTLLHALRRLTNDARHVHRPITAADARIAVALLERLLVWYFSELLVGPRRACAGLRELWGVGGSELLALLDREAPELERLRQLWRTRTGFEGSPIPGALYADILLSIDRVSDAGAVLDALRVKFPRDMRVRQLTALQWRLTGRSTEAEELLETLRRESPHDAEVLGILGGTLKRRWAEAVQSGAADAQRQSYLQRAALCYMDAWKSSRHTSTYTGINAATLALLSGKPRRATRIARAIVDLFEARRGLLAPATTIAFSGYWDRVTYAEALLVADNIDAARREYTAAMHQYAQRQRDITSSREQLALILPALGWNGGVAAFVEPPAKPSYARRNEGQTL